MIGSAPSLIFWRATASPKMERTISGPFILIIVEVQPVPRSVSVVQECSFSVGSAFYSTVHIRLLGTARFQLSILFLNVYGRC